MFDGWFQGEGAAEIPLGVEDQNAIAGPVPRDDRVTGPGFDKLQVLELSRPLARAAPSRDMSPRRVEDPHFVVSTARNHDPPVGEPHGIRDLVKHVGVLAFPVPDRKGRLGSDLPHP